MGGTAEKMIFLSMECDSPKRATKAALPSESGLDVIVVSSIFETIVLVRSFHHCPHKCVWVRLGRVHPHFHPPLQEYLILFLGIEAALWCTCFGLWFPKPTI
ncbi:hypothetical protein AMTRI_Chr04g246340 [Amborella trichopoda]